MWCVVAGVGGETGCFPEGRWCGRSDGCTVLAHGGLYVLAIVPIKLCNKAAHNSVANNKCLLLILTSTVVHHI